MINSLPDAIDAATLRDLLLERVGYLALGWLFLALGLAIVGVLSARRGPRHGVGLLFGVLSLLWGLRFLCRAPVIPLVVGGPAESWSLFSRFLTYLSAPPAFGVVWLIFGPGWRASLKMLTGVSVVFAAGASAMLLARPDPDLLIGAFNVMMLAGGVVIAGNLLRPEHRNHPELRTLVFGGLASLAIIVRENLRSLGLTARPLDIEWLAAIILYATLARIVGRQVVGAERRLAGLQQEMDSARQIQASILPEGAPAAAGLAVASRYVPMSAVAGDLYDFAELGGGRCGVLVADVSGHGVPAALVASMVKVAFQAQAGHHDDPALVLAGMNRMLGSRLDGKFVTAAYACVDAGGRTLRYAAAGHPPLVLVRSRGGIEPVVANGLILGVMPDVAYEATAVGLEPGDRLVMHTDGIVEAFDPRGEEFGDERLHAFLEATRSLPVEACADRLLAEVRAWAGGGRAGALEDDLTLVLVEVLPEAGGAGS